MSEEEGEKENADMRAVYVRIGHDNDLAVAELIYIEVLTDSAAESLNDRNDGGVCVNLIKS